ncbi:MAG: NUDIX domain-containing protein [Patescibacteria group bacterium]
MRSTPYANLRSPLPERLNERLPFLAILRRYEEYGRSLPEEANVLRTLGEHVFENVQCFERIREDGAKHIGASVFMMDRAMKKAWFIWNIRLKCWAQPGGHAEGERDIHLVAKRESREETGVIITEFLDPIPFEIQRYDFSAEVFGYKNSIFNLFFLAVLPDGQEPQIMEPDKHREGCWKTPDEAMELNGGKDHGKQERLIQKWKARLEAMRTVA